MNVPASGISHGEAKPVPSNSLHEVDATYKKVTRRLIPFLFICWMVNYIDRINVGFAKIPLATDIGLSEAAYGLGVGLFIFGYVIFEIPSNLLLTRIGARKTLARIMLLWGAISCLTFLVRTPTEFYVARFVLGVAEAGFYPGLILYLTFWFPSSRRARVMSRFLLAMAVAGVIGGPLAGLILTHTSGLLGFRNWQWLFFIEGLPAIVLGIVALFYLDDSPKDAKWLTASEKELIQTNLHLGESSKPGHDHGISDFLSVFRDPRLYLAVVGYTVIPVLGTVLNYWTPTIIHNIANPDIGTVATLSAIPFGLGALGMLVIARHSDRKLERRWHYFFTVSCGAVALLCLPHVAGNLGLALLCLSLVGVAYYGGSTIFWTIPPAYFPSRSASVGIAATSSLGQIGAVLAPILLGWAKTHTHSMAAGFIFIAALTVLGGLAIVLGIPRSALREHKLKTGN
ncbi:MFS transporter [Paraburkholderia sediminicola]|uniref:MFS transporter n=1 Tax=Paraburkholderia sediminicola TaxID=458836 RepID=UPI0038B9FB66